MHWVKVTRPKGHVLVLPFDNREDAFDTASFIWAHPELGDAEISYNVESSDAIALIKGLKNEQ